MNEDILDLLVTELSSTTDPAEQARLRGRIVTLREEIADASENLRLRGGRTGLTIRKSAKKTIRAIYAAKHPLPKPIPRPADLCACGGKWISRYRDQIRMPDVCKACRAERPVQINT